VALEHDPRPILGAAIGPGRQERTLVRAMHAQAREMGKFGQFFLARQPKLESRRDDGEAVQGPQVREHET